LNRLPGYDYSKEGWYFVTMNCYGECLGKIINQEMKLNESGNIVSHCWDDLPNHYNNCILDQFIIMPDHVHGIIRIGKNGSDVGNGLKPFRTDKKSNLSEIIRGFKTFSSKRIHVINPIFRWHKSFYDRIIRDEKGLMTIRNYIKDNPKN